jgi:hypothetical protein
MKINLLSEKLAYFKLQTSLNKIELWGPGIDSRPVHVRIVVYKVALAQVCHRVLRYSDSIIPPMRHTHIFSST